MTYRELIAELVALSDKQKDYDVTVYLEDADEYLPAEFDATADSEGVLYEDHPIFVIEW